MYLATRIDPWIALVLTIAIIASVASFIHFYNEGMIVAYGDSKARLLIARQVMDSINPGPPQLGGIWPPLPQIAMQPLIWSDTMYRTGIAGALPSMICFVIAMLGMYGLVVEFTGKKIAGLISAISFSGPNILFIQAVPMSEMPFMAFFILTIYFLERWVKNPENFRFLGMCGAAISLATWTRYEGWILLGLVSLVILFTFWRNKFAYDKSEGFYMRFAPIAFFGIAVWLGYNAAIFHNPLYFYASEYAPWKIAQDALLSMEDQHKTVGNISLSLEVYGRTVIDNAGTVAVILAIAGMFVFMISHLNIQQKTVAGLLLFPFFFFVFAIYQGNSVVIWHPDYTDGGNWGTRYGTLMMPAIAFFIGYLVTLGRALTAPITTAIIISSVMIWQNGLISMGEAVNNVSNPQAVIQEQAGKWLEEEYDRGLVLFQRFGNEHLLFTSSIPLKKVVYEGNENIWKDALDDPQATDIDWIIVTRNFGNLDLVGESLQGEIPAGYEIQYQRNGIDIYKRIEILTTSR